MKLLKFSSGNYSTLNSNYKYSNYNISLGTKIGAGLGALRGATVQGEAYTDPTTGQTFRKQIGFLDRTGKVVGSTIGGSLLGAIGTGIYRGMPYYRRSTSPI
jgi:hypothetical protein